jgi:nucleotide-binding universal stress UspA family protein
MWLTKKILVPCDFSDSSRRACEIGIEIAKTCRIPLTLLHVVPSAAYSDVPYIPVPEYSHMVEESARQALRDEAARYEGNGVQLSTLLKVGAAWEEIIETAKAVDAGLIVMGTHGRRGLPRALLGSVAEKVVRLSTVPVLTIRGAQDKAAESGAKAAPK